MDPKLLKAIESLHGPAEWVHVTPMITRAFGAGGLGQRSRQLSREGTSLGLLTPQRQRIYGIE